MQHFGAKPYGAEFFSLVQGLVIARNTAIARS